MSELGDVVEVVEKEPLALSAEDTSPKADVVEPQVDTVDPDDKQEAHPLEPDGKRFKQVIARAHKAEDTLKYIQTELQREREDRIRLEERLKAKEEAKPAEPEYTWAQYEAAIAEGKLTLGQAMEHREKVREAKLQKQFEEKLNAVQKTSATKDTVGTSLERYKTALPELMEHGSEIRKKVEREYQFLTELGDPPSLATQLKAVRAALGDIETVERSVKAKQSTQRDTHVETTSTTNRPLTQKNDPWKGLSEAQKEYYQKGLKNGQYKNMKEIEDELKFENPLARRKGY